MSSDVTSVGLGGLHYAVALMGHNHLNCHLVPLIRLILAAVIVIIFHRSDSSPLLSAPPGPPRSRQKLSFPSTFSSAVPSSSFSSSLHKPTSSPSPDCPPSSRARRTASCVLPLSGTE